MVTLESVEIENRTFWNDQLRIEHFRVPKLTINILLICLPTSNWNCRELEWAELELIGSKVRNKSQYKLFI